MTRFRRRLARLEAALRARSAAADTEALERWANSAAGRRAVEALAFGSGEMPPVEPALLAAARRVIATISPGAPAETLTDAQLVAIVLVGDDT